MPATDAWHVFELELLDEVVGGPHGIAGGGELHRNGEPGEQCIELGPVLRKQMHTGREQGGRGGVAGEDEEQTVGQQVRPLLAFSRLRRQQREHILTTLIDPFPQRGVEPLQHLGGHGVATLDVRMIALPGDRLPEHLHRRA